MTMTLAVYDVDWATGVKTERQERYEVPKSKVPEVDSAWPVCRCPLHSKPAAPQRR